MSRAFRGFADYLFTSFHLSSGVFPHCFSSSPGLLRARFWAIRRWWFLYVVTWMGYGALWWVTFTLGVAASSENSPRVCGRTPHKVAQFSREEAIRRYSETLRSDLSLSSIIWTLSGARLVCHCKPTQRCHADVLISLFGHTFPTAHDRDQERQPPPTASVLDFLAKLRNEPEEDEGSRADEGVPPMGAGEGGVNR